MKTIKESYILLLIVLGLVSLGIYTTYAMFTSSVEIGDISLDTTLQYTFKINSNEQFTIGSNSRIRFNAIVENDMSDTISYGVYYKMINPSTKEDNLIISEVTDSDTLKTSGPIESGLDKKITIPLVIINNTSSEVTIEIGVRTGFYNDNNKPENIIYQAKEYLIDTKIATSEVSNETCDFSGNGDCIESCINKIENGYKNTYCTTDCTFHTSNTKLTNSEVYNNLDISGANTPDLVDGLIPVMYDGSKWVKADETNSTSTYQWYDYNNKLWANAVLVAETNRSTYQNATPGTTIDESDILAYYVWIPRFKYKVWNINKVVGTDSYNARTTGIDIVFESEKASTGTISCTYSFKSPSSSANSPNETCIGSNGDYYTHPSFTFGSDNIRGFWIGKFEITGDSSKLTVLPNTEPIYGYQVSKLNTMIQNMQASSNVYGLSTSRANTDSHMITNMEWGAVAYLTNSKYGRCTNNSCAEVTVNNCSSRITGIAGDSVSASSSSTTCTTAANKYNGTKGVLASTTGNITGVYDMSGGAWEYTMGNSSGTSGSYTFSSSSYAGFSDNWYTTSTAKYLTTYAYGISYNDQTAYNRSRLGDGTGEVVLSTGNSGGWYGDNLFFVYSSSSWTLRGNAYYSSRSQAGIFAINRTSGNLDDCGMSSSRIIIVSLKQ